MLNWSMLIQVPRMIEPRSDYVADPINNVPNVNLPNALTLLRLVLVPVFVYYLLGPNHESSSSRWLAAIVFLIASVTDLVDGWLARKYSLVTNFGKVVDPIADKALTGSALIGLSYLGQLPWWITSVILTREVGITLLRFWVIKRGIIPASRGGKVKTGFQIVTIVAYLIPYGGLVHFVAVVSMTGAIILTVGTGVDYLIKINHLRRAV